MTDDPIVEEARKAGKAYIDSFGGDLKAVFADLQKRTEEARRAGHPVASPAQDSIDRDSVLSQQVGGSTPAKT
jgi:hypothetical protein